MTYNKTTWVSGRGRGEYAPGATKLNAAHLQNIENGIENVDTRVAALESGLEITPGSPAVLNGSGSPEGVVTAPVGTLYLRTDGGGVALYAKQTGTSNTGWVALTGTSPDPYVPPAPTSVQPFAAWGFNEGSGLSAYDVAGGGYTLTASNTSTSWSATGYSGAGGKSKFTASAVGPNATQANYTIMMRVRREGTYSGFAALFKNIAQNLWVEVNSARSYGFSIYADGSFALSRTFSEVNTWYHLACTRDSLGNTQIYVNGVLEGTSTGGANGVNFGSGGTFMVGDDAVESGHVAFNGTVDDLRIFPAVLTAEQIGEWANQSITATGSTPPASTGAWLSGGGYYTGQPGSDEFGTWRGTPSTIYATWMNDASLPTIKPGAEFGSWTGAMDIGMVPPTWAGWAAEAAGTHDAFWTSVFANMNTYRAGKGTTYVRMWYEFNGNWMAYSVTNATDVANFKTAWNRIAAIARTQFPGVKLTLGTSSAYQNSITVASCWPTATVDALSIDFYNNWPFTNTQGGFDSKIATAAGPNSLELLRQLAYNKGVPVIISEWANCGINDGGGGGGGESTAFIDAMYAWVSANSGTGPGQVLGEIYFNGWNQFFLYNTDSNSVSGAQPTTAARYVTKF